MKRILHLLFIAIVLSVLLYGCDSTEKRQVLPENDPALHIEFYGELTTLYGTERLQVLDALNCGIEDANVENWDAIGVPLKFGYADVEFEYCRLLFSDSTLYSVICEKTYTYPDELECAVEDAARLAAQLAEDLGKPHEVDTWNDWLEEEYQVEMDSEIPTYQDSALIRDMLNNNAGGCIMWWDMTSVASPEVRTRIQQLGEGARHVFYLNVFRRDDKMSFELCF